VYANALGVDTGQSPSTMRTGTSARAGDQFDFDDCK
jgi:hypothetical protein